ncbi:MAG: hypothetical protein HRT45_11145 [Bdellovibrionales bacterium]|nr:hypothetical protein [Bdellovibrionales bacterium]
MKKIFYHLLVALLVCSQSVYANLWGSGVWGGNQACPYDEEEDNRYDAEYYIENDEQLEGYREILERKRAALRRAEQRYEYYKEKAEEAEDDIKKVITSDAFNEGIRTHFERNSDGESACPSDYEPCCYPNDDTRGCSNNTPFDPDAAGSGTPATSQYNSPAKDLRYALSPFRFLGGGWPQAEPKIIDATPQRRPVQNIARNRKNGLNRFPAGNPQDAAPAAGVPSGGVPIATEDRGEPAVVEEEPLQIINPIQAPPAVIAAPITQPEPGPTTDCGEGATYTPGVGCVANDVPDQDLEIVEELIPEPDPVVEVVTTIGDPSFDVDRSRWQIPAPFCQDARVPVMQNGRKVGEKVNTYNFWNGQETNVGRARVGRALATCDGRVSPSICQLPTYVYEVIKEGAGEQGSRKREDCEDGLEDWYDDYADMLDYRDRVRELEDEIRDYERKLEDGIETIEDDLAEGLVPCLSGDCPRDGRERRMRPGLIGDILKIGAGALLTGYLGRRAIDQSTRAGYPAPPLTYAAMGWPFINAGLQGIMGGSWGCSNTIYGNQSAAGPFGPYGMMTGGLYPTMGGVFGYPPGMFGNPMGGGMYMPGMFPGGMPGPWGGLMPMPGGFPGMGGLGAQFGLNTPWGGLGGFSPYGIGGMGPFPMAGFPGGGALPPFFPQAGLNPYFGGVGGINPGAIPGMGGGFNPYGGNPFNPYGNPFSPFGNPYGGGMGNFGINSPMLGGQGLQQQIMQQQMAAQRSLMQLSIQQAQREQMRMTQLNVLYQDLARIQSQISSLNTGSMFSGGLPFSGSTGSIFGGISGGLQLPGLNIGGSIYGGVNGGFINGTSFPAPTGFNPSPTGGSRPPSSSSPR